MLAPRPSNSSTKRMRVVNLILMALPGVNHMALDVGHEHTFLEVWTQWQQWVSELIVE